MPVWGRGGPKPRGQRHALSERMTSSACATAVATKMSVAMVLCCWEKRKHTLPCSSEDLFFAAKQIGGHRGKISVVDKVFLVFDRVFVSTTGLESFSLRRRAKVSKRFSFGGGSVRFFFSVL